MMLLLFLINFPPIINSGGNVHGRIRGGGIVQSGANSGVGIEERRSQTKDQGPHLDRQRRLELENVNHARKPKVRRCRGCPLLLLLLLAVRLAVHRSSAIAFFRD